MGIFYTIMLGYFFGFALGVGCALAVFYAIYAQVETSYLTPKIMKSSVDLSALGVLIALLMGSKLAGVVGAMIAVPTAVLVSVLIQEYLIKENETALPVAKAP